MKYKNIFVVNIEIVTKNKKIVAGISIFVLKENDGNKN